MNFAIIKCSISFRQYHCHVPWSHSISETPLDRAEREICAVIKSRTGADEVVVVSSRADRDTIRNKYQYKKNGKWDIWGKAIIHLLDEEPAAAERICDEYQRELGV